MKMTWKKLPRGLSFELKFAEWIEVSQLKMVENVQCKCIIQVQKGERAYFIQAILSYVTRSYDSRVENEPEFSSGWIITCVIYAKNI